MPATITASLSAILGVGPIDYGLYDGGIRLTIDPPADLTPLAVANATVALFDDENIGIYMSGKPWAHTDPYHGTISSLHSETWTYIRLALDALDKAVKTQPSPALDIPTLLDPEAVEEFEAYIPENMQLWQWPENYIGPDMSNYYGYLSKVRDADAMSRANFDAACAELETLNMTHDQVHIMKATHWGWGNVETIFIHKTAVEALKTADKTLSALFDYPVMDESLFSKYEFDDATERWSDRHFDRVSYLRSHPQSCSYAELLAMARGNKLPEDYSQLLS